MKIYKGAILTCDKYNSVYNYLVEHEGIIRYVGNRIPEELKDEPVIDLGRKALIPAFADTHIHFASFAAFHSGLNVMEARSNAEILDMLKAYVKTSKNKLIIGFGASPYSVAEGKLVS
ncbi:MAG: amidohydrolase family protein, partial [Anaerotignum sp.]|nr:amidohydrolase family protein [Anaerotignum sp.]